MTKVDKYQAIVFDFGNIFMLLDYPTMFKNFSEILDMEFNIDSVPDDLMAVLERYERGEITDEEMIWAFQKIKTSVEPRNVIKAWNSLLVGMNAELFDFLKKLRKEYKLYLLSNINGFHERWIDRYMKSEHGVEDFKSEYFDDFFYSHHIGMRKPAPDIYRYVAQKLKEQGVESWLFIDDMEKNVIAAKEQGWSAIEHKPTDDISLKLESYLAMELNDKL